MFSIIQPLFPQKLSLYIQLQNICLFGSGIWIWAAKNLRFSLRVSVVRALRHGSRRRPRRHAFQSSGRIIFQGALSLMGMIISDDVIW